MTTQTYSASDFDMPPEQVGMLNGREAALQAAMADLLERGHLRQSASGGIEAGPAPDYEVAGTASDVTTLQHEIYQAIRLNTPRLENEPGVRSALDELQQDAVRRGLLNPPHDASEQPDARFWIRLAGLGVLGLAAFGVFGASFVPDFSAAHVLPVIVVGWAFALFRRMRGRRGGRTTPGGRTAEGTRVLQAMQARTPEPMPGAPLGEGRLGDAVALYGTRALLVAFPGAGSDWSS